jgi:hypothetical protein
MKFSRYLPLLLLSSACVSGGNLATMDHYSDVSIGASADQVVSQMGRRPSQIERKSDGSIEYIYVERINASARNITERRYIFVLKDGKVVSKRVKQSEPPAYKFDSFEMQTTDNQTPTETSPDAPSK